MNNLPQTQDSTAEPLYTYKKGSRSRLLSPVLLIIIVLVVALIFGGFYFLKNSSKSSQTTIDSSDKQEATESANIVEIANLAGSISSVKYTDQEAKIVINTGASTVAGVPQKLNITLTVNSKTKISFMDTPPVPGEATPAGYSKDWDWRDLAKDDYLSVYFIKKVKIATEFKADDIKEIEAFKVVRE